MPRFGALREEPYREGARTLRENDDRMGIHQTNTPSPRSCSNAVDAACAPRGARSSMPIAATDSSRTARAEFERVIGIEWNPHSVARAQSGRRHE